MLPSDQIARQQIEQYRHDLKNHFDVAALPRIERLKHYALHFAKYAGRIARDQDGCDLERTLVDSFLIGLSAANALKLKLSGEDLVGPADDSSSQRLLEIYTDAAGRFAEASEKSDHLEDFIDIARSANRSILKIVAEEAAKRNIDLLSLAHRKRQQISANNFLVVD